MDWDRVGEQKTNESGSNVSASLAVPPHQPQNMKRAFTDPAEYAELAFKMINMKDLMKFPSLASLRIGQSGNFVQR